MRDAHSALAEAARGAAAVLSGKVETYEVFARRSEVLELASSDSGEVVRRRSVEVGVACRVQKGRCRGFGRASGTPREAGEQAARLAMMSLSPGHEVLPASEHLGAVPVPVRPHLEASAVEGLLHRWPQDPGRSKLGASLVRAESFFHRSEGFTACWPNQLLLVEWQQELLPGVTVVFRRAGRELADLAFPSVLGFLGKEAQPTGLGAERGLRRVLLAPDVAAPLLVLLARHLKRKAHAAPAWDFWDLRQGEEAFLPMACDGEGYPARNLALLVGGKDPDRGGPDSTTNDRISRGAVRVPWDAPPAVHPVHLWQRAPGPPLRPETLDDNGLAALAPLSEVVLDQDGRFRLLAFLAELRSGRPQGHGVQVLSGSLPRLASSLLATYGTAEHVALGCVVSSPWLFVANLEVE